jgi:hypothetical protein
LITNDRSTMLGFAKRRAAAGDPLPGLIVATKRQSVGAAIEDIMITVGCLSEEEMRDRVIVFLPL